MQQLTKQLPFGLKTTDGQRQQLVYGKRPTVADSMRIEDDTQSDLDVQKSLMYARATLIEFGDKKRAPYLSEMLGLSRADRDVIIEGYNEFLQLTMSDRAAEKLDADTLKLAF